jgi:hypothetical protein
MLNAKFNIGFKPACQQKKALQALKARAVLEAVSGYLLRHSKKVHGANGQPFFGLVHFFIKLRPKLPIYNKACGTLGAV